MNFDEIQGNMLSLLERSDDRVSNLANASALLMESLPAVNWVGFYLVRGDTLYLGPFQGRVACTRILLGRGVCGTAAREDRIVRVADVHTFSWHIACDSASKSELVIPLHDNAGNVRGVLDLDSPVYDRFSAEDEAALAALAAIIEAKIDWT